MHSRRKQLTRICFIFADAMCITKMEVLRSDSLNVPSKWSPQIQKIEGDVDEIRSVVLSAHGKILASASQDGALLLGTAATVESGGLCLCQTIACKEVDRRRVSTSSVR